MGDASELKDELAVLGQHIQRFFVEDRRPWAEVTNALPNLSFSPQPSTKSTQQSMLLY